MIGALLAAVFVVGAAPAPLPPGPALTPETGLGGEDYVRAGFRAALALDGRLEGRWRLTDARGRPLYVFQLSDPNRPDPRASNPDAPGVEGAWRDLRRPHALLASGVLTTAKRDGDDLTLMFFEGPCASATTLSLHAAGRRWRGRLAGQSVVLSPD